MAETYQTFYIGEIRALQITVNDQDGDQFAPSGAFVRVLDDTGETIVEEQAAQVVSNTVNTLIGTATTGTVGSYKIIWRLLHAGHTYYHVSELEVESL